MAFYHDCGFGVKRWALAGIDHANWAHGNQRSGLGVSAEFLVVGLSQERQDILRDGTGLG